MRIFTLLFTFLVMVTTIAWAGGEVYADRDKMKIFHKPSVMSKTITVIKKGEVLTVIEKAGKFYRVRTRKGIAGYALKSHVTSKKPGSGGGNDDLDNLLGAVLGGGRSDEMNEESSSHSIRGLKDDGRVASGGSSLKSARQSVISMENSGVSASELEKFQREGKVGRYAR